MIRIVDAVMGTGKSTGAIASLNAQLTDKFIVVLPGLDEATRYKEGVSSDYNGKRNDVVALDTKGQSGKTQRFIEAVKQGKTVITTHNLFSRLTKYDFDGLNNLGEYTLLLDETIELVNKGGRLNDDIKDLLKLGYIKVEDHKTIEGLKHYSLLRAGEAVISGTSSLNRTAQKVSGKHVYRVGKHNVVFVVPPEKLTAFKDVLLMTYMFHGSETHAWLEVFSIPFSHHIVQRDPKKGLIEAPFQGAYSGSQFKGLLTVYDGQINDIGKKKARSRKHPLTKSWYDSKRKSDKDIKALMNGTRTFFRNMGSEKNHTDNLWSCYKDHRSWFKDGRFDPSRKQETFLAMNKRGTNDYAARHHLAYLVDVHPYPEIEQFFKMHTNVFDKDLYALSILVQWVWRSAIRKGEPVNLCLPSERMRTLLEGWLK